jgi:hypothetical protein
MSDKHQYENTSAIWEISERVRTMKTASSGVSRSGSHGSQDRPHSFQWISPLNPSSRARAVRSRMTETASSAAWAVRERRALSNGASAPAAPSLL